MRTLLAPMLLISSFFLPAVALCEQVDAKTATALGAQDVTNLLSDLRNGGYVLFMRHAATDQNQEDQRPVDLDNCKTQRNLSDDGRKQSASIGAVIKKLKIPIGNVISSPFCRCRDTAELAFKKSSINENLFFAMDLSVEGKKIKGGELKKLLSRAPEKGSNDVYVSHTANLQEALGYWPKPEAVIYIFKPTKNGVVTIGFVTPDVWEKLSE